MRRSTLVLLTGHLLAACGAPRMSLTKAPRRRLRPPIFANCYLSLPKARRFQGILSLTASSLSAQSVSSQNNGRLPFQETAPYPSPGGGAFLFGRVETRNACTYRKLWKARNPFRALGIFPVCRVSGARPARRRGRGRLAQRTHHCPRLAASVHKKSTKILGFLYPAWANSSLRYDQYCQ